MKHKIRMLSVGLIFVFGANSCAAKETNSTKVGGSAKNFPCWIAKEKIRAGFLSSERDTKYAASMRAVGLNTAILSTTLHRKKEFAKTLKNCNRWAEVSKEEGLHVFIAYNWQPDPRSFSGVYRCVVYSDGRTGKAPCPRDHGYWVNYLTHMGKVIAGLSVDPDLQIDGIFLDSELYSNRGTTFKSYGKETCFCDSCFSSFLLANGYYGSELPVVELASRKKWLEDNKFLDQFFAFLAKDVDLLAREYEQNIHQINPSLVIGMYPMKITTKNWVRRSVARGIGTEKMPIIIFANDTYTGGGAKKLPEQPAEYYAKEGINAVYAAGFLIRRYKSSALMKELPAVCKKCSGYWIFSMHSLWEPTAKKYALIHGSQDEYLRAIKEANNKIETFITEQ